MKKILLSIIISYLPVTFWGQSDTIFVHRIYHNLKQIKSASYFWYQSASAPYDTIPSLSYNVFKKEFDNPGDKLVGACIANFQVEDTTRLVYFYDGNVQSYPNWENKTIPVDSFLNNRYAFRTVYPPFFSHVKCLLKYALEANDKKSIHVNYFTDSVLISISVYDKFPEVVGNRIVYAERAGYTGDKWSKYEIWVNNVNNLPYRMVKRFPDMVCWEQCRDIKINTTAVTPFIASEYFPSDFAIKGKEKERIPKNLVGTVAPDWKLKAADGNNIALSDLKSKILVIQFTGIGCGPCYQSIPSLIKIRDQFNRDELEIISIETWNNDIPVIKKHVSANRINYQYLIGNSGVKSEYGIRSVPEFFVLDKKRVIRKIITGFDREKTCSGLIQTVYQLLKE